MSESEKQLEGTTVGGIKVGSLPEAENLEAQGFLSPEELSEAKAKLEPKPKSRVFAPIKKIVEKLRTH